MIFAFGFLLCISLVTDVVCTSGHISMNETLPIFPATPCDNINDCRTLSAIVYGCLATVLACVWVAVHPNIPRVPNPIQNWRHKLLVWATARFYSILATCIGIFVPEVLLIVSANQWANARQIARELQEASSEPLGAWTTAHGFWVIMGGFQYFDGHAPRHPLSRDDVESLVKAGTLEAPPEAELWARSKGSSFAKGCALLQTLWFVAQCGARAKEKLPLTQLEVMTLAYTLMTMAMYGFWWKKPLRVDRPIPIQMSKGDLRRYSKDSQTFDLPFIQTPPSSASSSVWTADPESNPLLDGSSTMQNVSYPATGTASHISHTQLNPATKHSTRLPDYSNRTYIDFLSNGSQMRIGRPGLKTRETMFVKWATASLVATFGCIHLLSWEGPFFSDLDRHIWQASNLFIAGYGGLFFAAAACSAISSIIPPSGGKPSMKSPSPVLDPGLQNQVDSENVRRSRNRALCIQGILWTFYGAARILMLYVCARNLSGLPNLAYRTVQWTTLLPHV
ncbi:hypothetical protein FIBSPDRAFT_933859 [Athelia psychrophila]|uniref:Uncharacterized protein n=1 Tax=Athelia psychrophila TaxID=1759441 RepID=A0A166GAJ1_9AGAM|nr:hypothetical protein FIBSPDRAFT_933859 [Fibularhizoctonia sp. CBS 109695]